MCPLMRVPQFFPPRGSHKWVSQGGLQTWSPNFGPSKGYPNGMHRSVVPCGGQPNGFPNGRQSRNFPQGLSPEMGLTRLVPECSHRGGSPSRVPQIRSHKGSPQRGSSTGCTPKLFPRVGSPEGGPPWWALNLRPPSCSPIGGFPMRVPQRGSPWFVPRGRSRVLFSLGVSHGRSRKGFHLRGIPQFGTLTRSLIVVPSLGFPR